jgi:hypothetical protein
MNKRGLDYPGIHPNQDSSVVLQWHGMRCSEMFISQMNTFSSVARKRKILKNTFSFAARSQKLIQKRRKRNGISRLAKEEQEGVLEHKVL